MHALDHEVTSRIELGTPVADLDTPALLVDLARMEANIARWQHAVSQHGIRFRPHIKTHKVPEIAALQLTAGATGIAVAKVSEAEIFAAHGCTDIVIAYPVVGESKWRRIAALARQAAITVNIDSEHAASGLSRAAAAADVTIGAQIEIDTGFHRCGFAPDDLAGVLSLSSTVGTLPGLRFDGVTTHRGVFFSGAEAMSITEAAHEEAELLLQLAERLRAEGLAVNEITAGGSITGQAVAEVAGVTEVRAGTYVFNDLMQIDFGTATLDQLALSVLCTVVSHPTRERATIDGGSKTFSGDRGLVGAASTGFDGVAKAVDRDIVLERISEEHGMARVGRDDVEIGEKIAFAPMHACTCVNLADELIGIRDGHVETIWPILARGKRT